MYSSKLNQPTKEIQKLRKIITNQLYDIMYSENTFTSEEDIKNILKRTSRSIKIHQSDITGLCQKIELNLYENE